jgi:opacity protein-like surface antigen
MHCPQVIHLLRHKKKTNKREKMKRYWQILLTCLLILVASVAPVTGAGPIMVAGPSNYVVGKLGAYIPTSNDLSGYDTGFSGEFAFGHYFNPYLALELGVGYFQTEGNVIVVYPGATYNGDEKIEVTPLTASLKVSLPVSIWVEPYAIAGIGAYFVYDHINVSNFHHDYISDNATAFGAHLGGGINFNINPNFFVGAECKYVWLDPSLYGADVNLGGVRVTGNFGVRF